MTLATDTTNGLDEYVPLCEPMLGENEKKWVLRCLDSGYVSSAGELVTEFERRFAKLVGAKYAVATSCGTAALHVAMWASGIRHDSSVILPSLTFVASMNPVMYCGARPVFMDVREDSMCLDEDLFEAVCTRLAEEGALPAAVVPVHLYGCTCDMTAIMVVAGRFGIKVIEDATEALGTSLHGRQVGTFGDVGCFSFNGNKMITTGSGGMVVTDSSRSAERIRYLVNQAKEPGELYAHGEIGFNYRMNSLSAAMGLAQLERFPEIVRRKKAIAERYSDALGADSGIRPHPELPYVDNSCWLYSVLLESGCVRERTLNHLLRHGIGARRFFEPLHTQPYTTDCLWTNAADPELRRTGVADSLSRRGMNLPCSPNMTDAVQDRVIEHLMSADSGSAMSTRQLVASGT